MKDTEPRRAWLLGDRFFFFNIGKKKSNRTVQAPEIIHFNISLGFLFPSTGSVIWFWPMLSIKVGFEIYIEQSRDRLFTHCLCSLKHGYTLTVELIHLIEAAVYQFWSSLIARYSTLVETCHGRWQMPICLPERSGNQNSTALGTLIFPFCSLSQSAPPRTCHRERFHRVSVKTDN